MCFLTVAVLFTFPAAAKIDTHFIGSPRGDKFQFIWGFWWVRYALYHLGQLPFFCPLQYYPTGASLALHDTTYFWSLLAVPLQSVMDPRAILNLFLLLCFPLNAMAAYRLARQVSGSHGGAMIGALIFAFCPYLVGRFHVCHIQYLGVFTLPLFLSALWRYMQTRRRRHVFAAAGWYCLTALISYYYAAALALVLAAGAVFTAIRHRRDAARVKGLIGHLVLLTAVAGALLSPFVAPAVVQLVRGDFVLPEEPVNNATANSGDLISYVVPDTTLASWLGWEYWPSGARWAQGVNARLGGNILEKSVYPGWIAWLALAAALCWPPLRQRAWPWAVMALGFFVLSLGPSLHVKGALLVDGGMPYRVLSGIPLFGIMRSPARLTIFISLGACVAAALAYAGAERAVRPAAVRWLGIGAALVVMLEFAPVPAYFTPNDAYRSPFYERLAAEPSERAVLNLPVDFTAAVGGGDIYVYAQSIHHKPIIGGYVSREPRAVFETLSAHPVLSALMRRQDGRLPAVTAGGDWPAGLVKAAADLSVGRIILHRDLLSPQEWQLLVGRLRPLLGAPVFEDRWILVFNGQSVPAQ